MLQTMGFLATIRTGGTMDRHAHNLVVVGSSPTRPTIDTNGLSVFRHSSEALFSRLFAFKRGVRMLAVHAALRVALWSIMRRS